MQKHGIASYHDLVRRAAEEPEWFYPAAFDHLGLEWHEPFDKVLDVSTGVPWAKWFLGGRTNQTWLAIDRWREAGYGNELAIVWHSEDGTQTPLTYEELGAAVDRAANGLRSIGIGPRDTVAIYLPMVVEAAVALHAVAKIGAIAVPAFSGYTSAALAERLELATPRAVITSDGALRGGRSLPMKSVVDEALTHANSVRHVVVVRRLGVDVGMSSPRDIWWEDLLDADSADADELQWFPPEHPYLLAFTSGSTGRPKGALHAHGRLPYRVAIELAFSFDMRRGDRMAWVTDMGWIMGPFLVTCPLVLGATAVIVEGAPDTPSPNRLWDLTERVRLTHLGLSPTLIRAQMVHGSERLESFTFDSLRIIGVTGEPLTPEVWRWLHRHVGRGKRPIINYSGGTEVGCGLLIGSPAEAMRAGRFAGPSLGIDAGVFDESGVDVVGKPGELVVKRPWPSMTLGFWKDDDRFIATYWSKWPNVWAHGDRAIHYADDSWELLGRSDDVIKVAGKRIGPTEYEDAANAVDGVVASAAVGVPEPIKGEIAVVVVSIRKDADPDSVVSKVEDRLGQAVGRAMRPAAVLVADQLPITSSGKVHRRAVRAWLTGADPGDLSTLENPEAENTFLAARNRLAAVLATPSVK